MAPAPTEIYTLSLHDALPIWNGNPTPIGASSPVKISAEQIVSSANPPAASTRRDRKSTRLNSSHLGISYAVFCLKKKKRWTGGLSGRDRNAIDCAAGCSIDAT